MVPWGPIYHVSSPETTGTWLGSLLPNQPRASVLSREIKGCLCRASVKITIARSSVLVLARGQLLEEEGGPRQAGNMAHQNNKSLHLSVVLGAS